MKNPILTILFFLIVASCVRKQKGSDIKKAILLADREAPLGWVYLRIYEDKSFEFQSRGLERNGDIYPGTMELNGDTITFHYLDSIPNAGVKAIIENNRVTYIAGEYRESMEIKLNTLSE